MNSINRRAFLRDGALGLAAASLATRWQQPAFADPFGIPVGLELYTVRKELQKDFDGTLREVAAIGYKEVESSNFANKTAPEINKSLSAAGLTCPAAHYMTPALRTGLDAQIAFAKEIGVSYMVLAFLQPNERKSLDDYRRLADFFNKVGEQCQKEGIQFAYHAHNFEYTVFDGVVAFDDLLEHTDPGLVKIELDCYWMTRAGKDPVTYLKKYPGRFPLLHIKDMKAGHPPTTDVMKGGDAFTEVGRGIIQWKPIFETAKGELKHYFVEQDKCDGPPIESARISYEYLHNLTV
ncbi:MAG TPA: sugar phosphate isomerase/epimerase [Terriglobia bacterium]|nr:sugar phosphate isomerase/epimerase [Terriglobia bacterium]